MANLGIIGTTTWGTTLATISASKDHKVTLFARTKYESDEMVQFNSNPDRIPYHKFPTNLNIDHIGSPELYESEILILAVPSESFRKNICEISNNINKNAIIISASKGLEIQSGKRMSEIISDELPSINKNQICALSGPNLAGEILAGLPSSSVIACENIKTAKYVQNILNSPLFRVYTNDDLIGVAIAAGISDGLKLGNNAKSAIITRGLAEMGRLGETLGARKSTFAGLSGMGDLIATCSSNMSRNYRAGEMIAQGQKTSSIIGTSKNVIEGIITTKSIMNISSSQNVELPLAKSVFDVLFNDLSPLEGVKNLMKREQTSETD